jgi:AcrR family transcriptional regulator
MLMALDRQPRPAPDRRERVAGVGAQGSGLEQEQIAQIQRARILAGLFDVVAKRGASGVTVADVVSRAGVSRRTFYELFVDREECLAAAFEHALELAQARVSVAIASEYSWIGRLRAGLVAFLRFLDEAPKLGGFLVCESISGGPGLFACRSRVMAQLATFVDEGRDGGAFGADATLLQAEGSVGGVLTILQNLMVGADRREPYAMLAGPLTAMIAMPYLGPERARHELEREPQPVAVAVQGEPRVLVDPLKAAGLRLTYRTVRVLTAVARQPAASNRRIGDLAEVADQGQISKLLRRLARAGLVENTDVRPGQGAPNAWRLTPAGEQLTKSIAQHMQGPGGEQAQTAPRTVGQSTAG